MYLVFAIFTGMWNIDRMRNTLAALIGMVVSPASAEAPSQSLLAAV